jgi:hypothetical protein
VKECKDGEGASQESLYILMSDGETHIAWEQTIILRALLRRAKCRLLEGFFFFLV